MLDKLIVFTIIMVIALASDVQLVTEASEPTTSIPIPTSAPVPSIFTYSGQPDGPDAPRVEGYKTVTTHPPPSAYKSSPAATPYVPAFVNPASSPVTNVPSYLSPGYANSPASPGLVSSTGSPQSTSDPENQARNRQLIKLVDTSGYGPFDPQSKPATVQIPVQFTAGQNDGAHVVYAPVENSVAYTKPAFRPVATYAVQSAYANYARSAAAYSPPQYSPAQNLPAQYSPLQYTSPAQFPAPQYPAAQISQAQYPAAQYSPGQSPLAQYTPAQYPTAQFPGAQYSAVQFSPRAYSPADAVSHVRFNGIGANYGW